MKVFITLTALCLFSVCNAQLRYELEALRKETGITSQQVLKLMQIDTVYLQEMENKKEEAETGYNPPHAIQLQHTYSLLRRLKGYRNVLTEEQYSKMKKLRFDIYPYKEWMDAFYKKNKRPPIKEAIASKLELQEKETEEN